MDYVFLGTGAAEAIPCYYCRCSYCNYARQHGGKDVRAALPFALTAVTRLISARIFFTRPAAWVWIHLNWSISLSLILMRIISIWRK